MRALDAASLARWRSRSHRLRRARALRSRDWQAVRAVRCRAAVPAARLHAQRQRPLALPGAGVRRDQEGGKTTLAAIIMLVMILLYGGRFAEGYCVANDLEQAQCRVFAIVKRIIEASPLLRAIAKLTSDRVTFPALDASIIAIASDAASAAGANPVITMFRRVVGLHQRTLTPAVGRDGAAADAQDRVPLDGAAMPGSAARACCSRRIYKRGMALPEVAPDLHAGDGMLMLRGTPSRSRRGRRRRGSRRCAAAAAQRLRAHDLERVRHQRERSSSTWRRGMRACGRR